MKFRAVVQFHYKGRPAEVEFTPAGAMVSWHTATVQYEAWCDEMKDAIKAAVGQVNAYLEGSKQ